MKRTFQPHNKPRKSTHGFRSRMATHNGRKVLARRRAKGRKTLTVQPMMRWIKRHHEYLEFFGSDHLLRTKHFFVPVLSADEFAVGITVSKRIGNAVVRNLLKRRIKAFVRQNVLQYPLGVKINIIARTGAGELPWQTISSEISRIFQDSGSEPRKSK